VAERAHAARGSGALRAPRARDLLGEAFGLLELPKLMWRAPWLARQPRGHGEPVLVLPGYGTGDASTALLRAYLTGLGYRAEGWRLGRNDGDVRALLPRVMSRLESLARARRSAVRLIGWSLGGFLAREAARERPDAAALVITLGTPVRGGPKYTAVAPLFRRRGHDLDAIEAEIDARNRTPLATPVTALYSRGDGVVAWQACIDRHTPGVEHVEVGATHLGLGFSAEVFAHVAQRLARAGLPKDPDSARSRRPR
jgi:pimeloyl-ACP methyl ester carboxylesterase